MFRFTSAISPPIASWHLIQLHCTSVQFYCHPRYLFHSVATAFLWETRGGSYAASNYSLHIQESIQLNSLHIRDDVLIVWYCYSLSKKAERKLVYLAGQLESLNSVGETPDPKLQTQINTELNAAITVKLREVGLLLSAVKVPTLGKFLETYIAQKNDVSDHCRYKLRNTAKLFCECFGANRKLMTITAGDVEDYQQKRKKLGRADATIGAEIKHGKQFFDYAVRKRYLRHNPFKNFRVARQANRSRFAQVPPKTIQTVIDAAPSTEWKALIAIVRWTGCRISEALLLKWGDILWDEEKIVISSTKTERFAGHEQRIVPLWPDLRPYLNDLYDQAPEGTQYLIETLVRVRSRKMRMTKNMGTQFKRIIQSAGIEPWPKPWQNLRASRENELEQEGFRRHVIRQWIGHSEATAQNHYLQVLPTDFERALASGHMVGSNGAQQEARTNETEVSERTKPTMQADAASGRTMQSRLAPRRQLSSKPVSRARLTEVVSSTWFADFASRSVA